MTDDVTRWSVTYTKHIKQKRKVYQDGFLEVQSSSHKVKLYDECDKLLDSKIVKLDDAVKSGETITVGVYLVDIGDPQGDTKPIPNLILQRDKTITDKAHMSNTKSSKVRSHIGKTSAINLSPSQKIIREFKRREVKKYCSPPSCPIPNTTKDDSTEWEVLYTTQLTQKSKKFHDGILKIAISGLRGRQAILYDETRKQLDSRFLKNDETITAGESMKFDGHLVDIIELKDNKPIKDSNVDGRNCFKQNSMQSKIHNEHISEFKKHEINKFSTKSDLKEWDVMYTTQVTQKAKKFHDGVLKLASCGSQGREEATLLSEDGTVLSHRYLKLSEDIKSGSLFNMSNYLVEIGEQRKDSISKGECLKKGSTLENETLKVKRFDVDDIKLSKRIPTSKPLSNEEPPKRVLPLQDNDIKTKNSYPDKVTSTPINKTKPLRNARSILSILKRPNGQEGVDIEKQKDLCSSSTKSDVAVCNVENSKKVDIDISLETVTSPDSSKATYTSNLKEPAKETKDQSNIEICGGDVAIDSSVHDDDKLVDAHDVSNEKAKDFKNTNLRTSDFPSFDLGFD